MSMNFDMETYSSKIGYKVTHQQKKTQHIYNMFVKIVDNE